VPSLRFGAPEAPVSIQLLSSCQQCSVTVGGDSFVCVPSRAHRGSSDAAGLLCMLAVVNVYTPGVLQHLLLTDSLLMPPESRHAVLCTELLHY
jgi:hypothetical protein